MRENSIGSSYIEIYFDIACNDAAIVKNVTLVIKSLDEIHTRNETLTNIRDNGNYYKISGLQGYTNYSIIPIMFSERSFSAAKTVLYIRTKQDISSEPRNLKLLKVWSDGAVLSWECPEQKNGIIGYYELIVNNLHYIIQNESSTANDTIITYTLFNLTSFTDYRVLVTAFTVDHSKPSNGIHFRTKIGGECCYIFFTVISNSKHI